MNLQNEKCVIVVDEALPLGIIANTAVILGITLGKTMPEAVGPDVSDQTEKSHLGIIKFPVPVLKSSAEKLKYIREQLYQDDFHDLLVVDFSDLAQSCKTYDDFTQKMTQVPESALKYFGLAICGSKKKVAKLTGSLPLYDNFIFLPFNFQCQPIYFQNKKSMQTVKSAWILHFQLVETSGIEPLTS